jgi:hypothetical protein
LQDQEEHRLRIVELETAAEVAACLIAELETVVSAVPVVIEPVVRIVELETAAEVAASLIAELQTTLYDKEDELMKLSIDNCVLKTKFNHYQTCVEIASRRTTELEARIADLDGVVSAVPVAVIVPPVVVIEPPVVVIEPVPVAVIEPMPVAIDMLPRGYSFEGATTIVNNVSYRVVRGPNMGYHTLRAPLVLKRLSAVQFSRMIREE